MKARISKDLSRGFFSVENQNMRCNNLLDDNLVQNELYDNVTRGPYNGTAHRMLKTNDDRIIRTLTVRNGQDDPTFHCYDVESLYLWIAEGNDTEPKTGGKFSHDEIEKIKDKFYSIHPDLKGQISYYPELNPANIEAKRKRDVNKKLSDYLEDARKARIDNIKQMINDGADFFVFDHPVYANIIEAGRTDILQLLLASAKKIAQDNKIRDPITKDKAFFKDWYEYAEHNGNGALKKVLDYYS